MATENEIDVKDIMRIMITTDNHLGYGEKNTIIGNHILQYYCVIEM